MGCIRIVPFLEYRKIDHLLSQFILYLEKTESISIVQNSICFSKYHEQSSVTRINKRRLTLSTLNIGILVY